MHYVVVKSFEFASVPYAIGDEIIGNAYTNLTTNFFFQSYVVAVSDSAPAIQNGNTNSSTGGDDVPLSAGVYSIPPNASTNGILSLTPVRILDIVNTDGVAQGVFVKLFDASDPSQISTAHCLGTFELGASQVVIFQRLTTVGLLYEIVQGDSGATAINSTGGVDISYAAY